MLCCVVEILTFVNAYELSAPVKALFEGGHKNAREMHIKIQDLIIPERMAELRGPQDMHAGCFSDIRLAFEYCIALLRLQAVRQRTRQQRRDSSRVTPCRAERNSRRRPKDRCFIDRSLVSATIVVCWLSGCRLAVARGVCD